MLSSWCKLIILIVIPAIPLTSSSAGQDKPAGKTLRAGKIQVVGRYSKTKKKDGKKEHRYFVLEEGNKFRLRVGGPASLVILARGFDKGEVTFELTLNNAMKGESKEEKVTEQPTLPSPPPPEKKKETVVVSPPQPPSAEGKIEPVIDDLPVRWTKIPYIGIGLTLDLLITAGKPSSTSLSAGDLVPSGSHGLAVPLLLAIRGYFAISELITISPGIEVGWFRLSGDGSRELPNDPDFGTFGYSWVIDNLPLFVGLSITMKPLDDLPMFISVGGGFASTYSWAKSTYKKEGQDPVTNAVQSDWGIGYYIGIEGAYKLGPGRITLEYRYSSARTDLRFKDIYGNTYNRELGDLEGNNILIGYRFDISW